MIEHAKPAAYAFHQRFEQLDTVWRAFPEHYLLYAASGTMRLTVETSEWLLPPQRAAWIAAQTPFCVQIDAPVTCASVLFANGSIPAPNFACRVFSVSSLAREMILYAMRWGTTRSPGDADANAFFAALAHVGAELAATPDQLWLPRLRSAELIAAATFTVTHLDKQLVAADVAQVAGISERTLARRFAAEAGMSWGAYLRRARMIRATELLANGQTPVLEAAFATGFESASAFNHAFRQFSGESPAQYRRRFRPN